MKKVKFKFLAFLSVALCLVAPHTIFAETVSVIGGDLTITQTPLTFSSVTLDVSANQNSTGSNTVDITDERGTGAGWSVSLAVSDFVTSIPDPTASSGDITLAIPANAVTVSGGTVTFIAGQSISSTAGPLVSSTLTLSNTPTSVINTSPGYGMGKYSVPLNFNISLPKMVTVQAVGTDSKYTAGSTQIGLYAGTYTSTFTYTTTAGV